MHYNVKMFISAVNLDIFNMGIYKNELTLESASSGH